MRLVTVPLPLSVSVIWVAVASTYYERLDLDNNSGQTANFTAKGFKVVVDGGQGAWVALCK